MQCARQPKPHDNSETPGECRVSDGFSKPKLLIWSATSNCTGDDIHCASAATAISGDAVEGGCKDIYSYINVQFNKHWSEEISVKPALTKVWTYGYKYNESNAYVVWLKLI